MAGKKVDSRPSLGTLFLAAQFLDVLWPIFILLGLEHVEIDALPQKFLTLHFTSYPYSHSLAAAIFWSLAFGVTYYLIKKNLKVSVILGALVFSHWILDLIVHVSDLQLVPGVSARVGLGLYNSTVWTIVVEGLIFVVGIFLYIKSTKAKNIRGQVVFWSLMAFLAFAYVMNLTSPPPPSVKAIAYAGLSQWLIIAWAYWADRNRMKEAISLSIS
ncbi:MAG: hypothetical protein ACLP05_01495 [Candidatus Kryptoniota bacterium]